MKVERFFEFLNICCVDEHQLPKDVEQFLSKSAHEFNPIAHEEKYLRFCMNGVFKDPNVISKIN